MTRQMILPIRHAVLLPDVEYRLNIAGISDEERERLEADGNRAVLLGVRAEEDAEEIGIDDLNDLGVACEVIPRLEEGGAAISAKYAGMNERAAVFAWYNTVTALAADLKKSGKTAQANLVSGVAAKTLEPAYNYYQIEAKSRTKYLFPLLLALGFYVLYTCWYGFGILYLFESMGVKLEH